jgi:hypothetical protein
MPHATTALLGTLLHLVRSGTDDPQDLQHAAALLARANFGATTSCELRDDDLVVNEAPIARAVPGATLVRTALREHGVRRLHFPSGMTWETWLGVVQVLASPVGLYTSPREVELALAAVVPGVEFMPADAMPMADEIRIALADVPGAPGSTLHRRDVDPSLASATADRATLSSVLDPLVTAAAAAVERKDYEALAHALLQIEELESTLDDGARMIVQGDRRRAVPLPVLERLVRELPSFGAGSAAARAVDHLGRDGVTALLDVLDETTDKAARRLYLDLLVRSRGGDDLIARGLDAAIPSVQRDAADILGRRGTTSAVPALARLLRHDSEDVRTAVWRALEQIGTPEALKALQA